MFQYEVGSEGTSGSVSPTLQLYNVAPVPKYYPFCQFIENALAQ